MSDQAKIIEVMARAGASFEEVEYDRFPELFIEQAEYMLAALAKSGMAVVPVQDANAIEKALAALGTDGYRARLDYTEVWRKNAQEAVNHLRAAQNRAMLAASKETER